MCRKLNSFFFATHTYIPKSVCCFFYYNKCMNVLVLSFFCFGVKLQFLYVSVPKLKAEDVI